MTESTEATLPSLFIDIEGTMRRLREVFGEMENNFEDGTSILPDLTTELRETLLELYPRIVAALERYGHSERARELKVDWESSAIDARFAPQYHPIDGGGFVDCPAYNLIQSAVGVLKDAFEHSRRERAREQEEKIEEAKRQGERDGAIHQRMLEVRSVETAESRASRKWQLYLTLITAVVSVSVGISGNLDKLSGFVGRSTLFGQSIVMEGTIASSGSSAMPIDLEIDCVPHISGVSTAVGGTNWSLTVLSSVSRPLQFYCQATSKELISEPVTVSVPSKPTSAPVRLPDIQLSPRSQLVPNPHSTGSAPVNP